MIWIVQNEQTTIDGRKHKTKHHEEPNREPILFV
jgi:hypothetical protein